MFHQVAPLKPTPIKAGNMIATTEKGPSDEESGEGASIMNATLEQESRFRRWYRRATNIPGFEQRGIERVPDTLRHPKNTVGSYVQMFLVWFAINCSANNMTIGILGPAAFGLGFTDAIV